MYHQNYDNIPTDGFVMGSSCLNDIVYVYIHLVLVGVRGWGCGMGVVGLAAPVNFNTHLCSGE